MKMDEAQAMVEREGQNQAENEYEIIDGNIYLAPDHRRERNKELEMAQQEIGRLNVKRSTSSGLSSKLLLFFLFILTLTLLISILYLFIFMNDMQDKDRNLKHLQNQVENLTAAINKKFEDLSMKLKNSDLVQYSSVMLLNWYGAMTERIRIYNSKQGNWSDCQLKFPFLLGKHGAALLNNEIYVFGGYDGNENLKNCYKLGQDNKWIEVAAMKEKRFGITRSSVVFNSEIWVFGGWDGVYKLNKGWNGISLKSVEKYDPKANIWTKMPDMIERRNYAAASVIEGKIYISGGWNGAKRLKSVEVYDPSKNQWEFFTDMPFELDSHSSEVEDSHLIIIGGDSNVPSNEVWEIDVKDPKKKWVKMPSLNNVRWAHGSVKLYNGLTVIGGYSSSSFELFNGKRWLQKGTDNVEIRRPVLIPLTWENEYKFRQQLLCAN